MFEVTYTPNKENPGLWTLSIQVNCSRQTLWNSLTNIQNWQKSWGNCNLRFKVGEFFIDRSNSISDAAISKITHIVTNYELHMAWEFGKDQADLFEKFDAEQAVQLKVELEHLGPAQMSLNVTVLSIGRYKPRGRWSTGSRDQWEKLMIRVAQIAYKSTMEDTA
jgi:hypothetical protein